MSTWRRPAAGHQQPSRYLKKRNSRTARAKSQRCASTYSTRKAQGFYPVYKEQHKFHTSSTYKNVTRRRVLYIVVMLVLFAVFAYATVQVTIYLAQTYKAKQEEQRVSEMIAQSTLDTTASAVPSATLLPTATPAPTASAATAAPTAQPQAIAPAVLIQFTNALATNPDTVGQLKVGESINTYVVQRDNSYYLRHSFSNEYSFSGAIFMDVTCSIYPRSRNLIIHGHNMQNGTAFGKLLRFETRDYLDEYPIIYFSTLYESASYQPFAVIFYSIDPESEEYLNLYAINSLSDNGFIDFVQTVQARSLYHISVTVPKTADILTLTTCTSGDDPDLRFAVFAMKNTI